MNTCLKFFTCFALLAFAGESYVEAEATTRIFQAKGSRSDCCDHSCKKRARDRALEINEGIDRTFSLLVPETAEEGARDFASFFVHDGIFQSPGGSLIGKEAIFEGFLAYAENPGEEDQHVITRKTYWDAKKATLTVERTWFATLTAPRTFGTFANPVVLQAGDTYSQDDALIVRFSCDPHCHDGCTLPGKVVYYREYFDPGQFESNFISDYLRPCEKLE